MECKSNISVTLQTMMMRINRYIMECKFAWADHEDAWISELIDTLWNVNPYVQIF